MIRQKKNHSQVHHEIEKISSKQSLKIIILFEIKCIQNKITATMCLFNLTSNVFEFCLLEMTLQLNSPII